MGTILRHGTDQQKQTYLPKIATGELRLQAFGVTEPTSGTDTTSLRTFARREGDHYVVNGQKVWTSRAEHSDLMLLLARTTPKDQTAKKTDGLSTIILSKNTSVELWFIIVRMGRIVSPFPSASRMSTMKVDRPSVRFSV